MWGVDASEDTTWMGCVSRVWLRVEGVRVFSSRGTRQYVCEHFR
jgi:hypothetical protein